MPFFNTDDGVQIAFREHGSGPRSVVFIHGWSTGASVWDEVFEALKDEPYRLVALDLRGAGESGRPPGGYAIDRFAADVRSLLRHLHLSRVTVVGHSMGGQVAQWLAATGPEVEAQVLVCSVLARGLDLPADARRLFRTAAGNAKAFETIYGLACKQLPAAGLRRLVALSLRQEAAAIEGGVDAFTGASFEVELTKIKCPTLVVATDDPFLPLPLLRELLVQKIPGAGLAYLPGPGHYPMVERPAETAAIVQAFLAGSARS